jgi:adenylate cyclase
MDEPGDQTEAEACLDRTRRALSDWLIETRERRQRTTLLFDDFCRLLLRLKVPVERVTLHLPQLHPQIGARTCHWERQSGGAVETGWQHGSEDDGIFLASPIRIVFETARTLHCNIDPNAETYEYPVLKDLAERGYRDYAAFPLRFSNGETNVLTIATLTRDGFSQTDLEIVATALPYLAVLVELNQVYRTARELLATYLGRNTGGEVLRGTIKRGDGRRIEAALWVCDLRGFTQLSQSHGLERVIPMLNDYFDAVGEAVHEHGGEILKFIGDAVIAIFSTGDGEHGQETACQAALAAAEKAITNLDALGRGMRCGVALHFGEALYGNIGFGDRLDFTVVGPDVNLVSRLEAFSAEADPPIAISAAFGALCGRPLRSLGERRLKGIEAPQEIFTLAR